MGTSSVAQHFRRDARTDSQTAHLILRQGRATRLAERRMGRYIQCGSGPTSPGRRPTEGQPTMQVTVNLIYDADYEGYVADVPELPGCMSQGKTIEEALANAREAVELYLEVDPEGRRSPLKPTLTTVLEV